MFEMDSSVDTKMFNGQLPVSVIASFSQDGKMIPIYFGIDGNKIKIDNIRWNSTGRWGYKYRCEITDNGLVKTVDLLYYSTINQWKIKI